MENLTLFLIGLNIGLLPMMIFFIVDDYKKIKKEQEQGIRKYTPKRTMGYDGEWIYEKEIIEVVIIDEE